MPRLAAGLLHVTEYLPMRSFTPKPTAVGPSLAMQAPARLDAGHGQGKTAGAFLGLLDLSTVDTTPGARCALAPPTGLDLDAEGYRDLMRGRYRNDPGARQHMLIFARRLASTKIIGPWAAEARSILDAICSASTERLKRPRRLEV